MFSMIYEKVSFLVKKNHIVSVYFVSVSLAEKYACWASGNTGLNCNGRSEKKSVKSLLLLDKELCSLFILLNCNLAYLLRLVYDYQFGSTFSLEHFLLFLAYLHTSQRYFCYSTRPVEIILLFNKIVVIEVKIDIVKGHLFIFLTTY